MSGALGQTNASHFSDKDLFAKLDMEVGETKVVSMHSGRTAFLTWTYRVAAAVALIMVGFWVGGKFSTQGDVEQIQQELGATMVVIEHDMPMIMALSDRVYCLEAGQVIAEGAPDEVRNDPKVIASYLGITKEFLSKIKKKYKSKTILLKLKLKVKLKKKKY